MTNKAVENFQKNVTFIEIMSDEIINEISKFPKEEQIKLIMNNFIFQQMK